MITISEVAISFLKPSSHLVHAVNGKAIPISDVPLIPGVNVVIGADCVFFAPYFMNPAFSIYRPLGVVDARVSDQSTLVLRFRVLSNSLFVVLAVVAVIHEAIRIVSFHVPDRHNKTSLSQIAEPDVFDSALTQLTKKVRQ